jgi:hypothetical protein
MPAGFRSALISLAQLTRAPTGAVVQARPLETNRLRRVRMSLSRHSRSFLAAATSLFAALRRTLASRALRELEEFSP